jgi:hypothetical protein
MSKVVIAGLGALMLAGCGSHGGGNTSAAADGGATASAGGAWSAKDACGSLDKAAIAATMKSAVSSAEPGAITDGGDAGGSGTQCTYMLADGTAITLQTVQANPDPGLTQQVAANKQMMKTSGDSSSEDIGGVGKAGIWAHMSRVMFAFYGGGRMASIAIHSIGQTHLTEDQIKTDELALLKAIKA